jgi:exopolysaccharide biosynthesis polyprenyl glycosylphosphotransferase
MLGRKQEIFLKLNQLLDASLIILAGVLAYYVRIWLSNKFQIVDPLDAYLWIIAITAVGIPLFLEMLGYYKHPLEKTWNKSLGQILQAFLFVIVAAGFIFFFLEKKPGAIIFLSTFGLIGILLLVIKDHLVRHYFKLRGLAPEDRESVIMVGKDDDVEKLLLTFPSEFQLETNIVERFDPSHRTTEELAKLLTEKNIGRVFIATRSLGFGQIEQLVSTCEIQGIEAWLSTSFVETAIARPTFDSIGERPMLVFRSTPDLQWALAVKWILDKIGALVGLVVCLPLFVFIYIGIKVSSPGGPVVFKQKRSGRYGKPFTMYKFRSMVPDAEAKRLALMDQNTMSGPVFKVDRDPRIFPFGSFLRKSSLDELPQLLNVLRGEMSLVGPRPLAYYEAVNVADAKQRRRFSVKPGLTCLWQISGRNNITEFDQWCALDLKYIDNWSLWLDIKIILLTIPVLLGFSAGAK